MTFQYDVQRKMLSAGDPFSSQLHTLFDSGEDNEVTDYLRKPFEMQSGFLAISKLVFLF
jgi:hypothetical protein